MSDAFAAHDMAKEATFLADDFALYFYGSVVGGETHGKADMIARAAKSTASDAKLTPTRIWIERNVAIEELTFTGTMNRDTSDIKATNNAIGQKRAVVLVFNDDGLVEESASTPTAWDCGRR